MPVGPIVESIIDNTVELALSKVVEPVVEASISDLIKEALTEWMTDSDIDKNVNEKDEIDVVENIRKEKVSLRDHESPESGSKTSIKGKKDKCPVCLEMYPLCNLRSHVRQRHDRELCLKCSLLCSTGEELEEHMIKSHGMPMSKGEKDYCKKKGFIVKRVMYTWLKKIGNITRYVIHICLPLRERVVAISC